jgi:hypothetical protein
MSFIQSYTLHTSIYESPGSFWKWSGYVSIAAVLKDRCYLPQGDSKLFPNIYVLCLAESSGHRKERPVQLSETMVNTINLTKIISGRTSIEALLDELARGETDAKTGRVNKSGAGIFYAGELAAGIVSNPEAIKILCDIYDYKPNPYKSRLRTGPCFNLEKVVLSMMAASNQDMLKAFFDIVAIKGGMLARTNLIVPNEERTANSLLDVDPEERKISLANVITHLAEISKLDGVFIFEEEAKDEYKRWYNDFRKSYVSKKEATGVVGRIHTTAIKVSMLLAANDLDLHIKKCHIEQAINECIGLIPNYSLFTMNNAKNDIGQAGGLIVTELAESERFGYMLSRKELIRRHWQNGIDLDMIDKIASTLETAGLLQQIQCKDGIYLKLTNACLETLGVKVKVDVAKNGRMH